MFVRGAMVDLSDIGSLSITYLEIIIPRVYALWDLLTA